MNAQTLEMTKDGSLFTLSQKKTDLGPAPRTNQKLDGGLGSICDNYNGNHTCL